MAEIRFQWDPRKARANLRKYGVSFTEAETVFADEHGLLLDDPEHADAEDRFILLGSSPGGRLLVVVHAYWATTGIIRIISARRADRLEWQLYQERELT